MRRILFTVSAFPPESEIGCIRVGNVACELKRKGYIIDVISVSPGKNARILNEFNAKEYCNSLKNISNGDLFSKLFLKKRDEMLKKNSAAALMSSADISIKSRIKAGINIYIQYAYSLLRNIDLYFQFKKILKKDFSSKSYDFIFSSYPSLCSIWAGRYAADLCEAKLITDFRDPIFYQHNTFWIKSILNRYFEKEAIKKADLVTSVSEGIMRNHIKDFGNKIHVLYNGFKSSNSFSIEKIGSEKFRISYLGSLYGGQRDLTSFFEIIKLLKLESDELQSKFLLCYAGKESDLFNALAKKHGIDNLVKDFGLLDKKEALDLQSSSDMLLVITWNTEQDQGILTGKLFESFSVKAPIFGIVQGNIPKSEFAKVINEVNGGILLEESKYGEKEKILLLENLKNMIDAKQRNEVPKFYNDKLDDYKIENVIDKLIYKMEDIKR